MLASSRVSLIASSWAHSPASTKPHGIVHWPAKLWPGDCLTNRISSPLTTSPPTQDVRRRLPSLVTHMISIPVAVTINLMYPIFGRYGPFFLYSYTACLAVTLLLSYFYLRRQSRETHWPLIVLASLLPALLIGRAAFIALNWSYYSEQPAEIWRFGQGGLAAPAVLLTTLLLLTVYLARTGRSSLFSTLAIPLTLAWSGGWLACYLEGCAYGAPTTLHPLAADLPDNFGVFALRYQTQLLGLAGALLTLILLIIHQRRTGTQSRQSWLTLACLCAQQLLLLPWRGDPAPLWLGWRLDGWAWLLAIIWALTSILSETRSLRAESIRNGP